MPGRLARAKMPLISLRRRAGPRRGLKTRYWWSTRTRPKAATREPPKTGAHLNDGTHRLTRRPPEQPLEVSPKPKPTGPRTQEECAPVETQGCDGHQHTRHRSPRQQPRPELPITCHTLLTEPVPPRRHGPSRAASLPRFAPAVTRRTGRPRASSQRDPLSGPQPRHRSGASPLGSLQGQSSEPRPRAQIGMSPEIVRSGTATISDGGRPVRSAVPRCAGSLPEPAWPHDILAPLDERRGSRGTGRA